MEPAAEELDLGACSICQKRKTGLQVNNLIQQESGLWALRGN